MAVIGDIVPTTTTTSHTLGYVDVGAGNYYPNNHTYWWPSSTYHTHCHCLKAQADTPYGKRSKDHKACCMCGNVLPLKAS